MFTLAVTCIPVIHVRSLWKAAIQVLWGAPLSNPVPWQKWMAAYLGCTLQMKTLFPGWPIMAHDTHIRRRRNGKKLPKFVTFLNHTVQKILTRKHTGFSRSCTALSTNWWTCSTTTITSVAELLKWCWCWPFSATAEAEDRKHLFLPLSGALKEVSPSRKCVLLLVLQQTTAVTHNFTFTDTLSPHISNNKDCAAKHQQASFNV